MKNKYNSLALKVYLLISEGCNLKNVGVLLFLDGGLLGLLVWVCFNKTKRVTEEANLHICAAAESLFTLTPSLPSFSSPFLLFPLH